MSPEHSQYSRPPSFPVSASTTHTFYSYCGEPPPTMPGHGSKKPGAASSSRARTASSSSADADGRHSHDLSISSGGGGRESLVDNLLLSFDRLGSDGGFDHSSYFSTVDELDDDDSISNYSHTTGPSVRGRRSNSTGTYHSANTGTYHRNVSNHKRQYGSFEFGSDSFSTSYETRPETRSRGRGLSTSHGYPNAPYDPFDAAPPPSVRSGPRNRSPSPPRLVRRPSNKSARSLRRGDPQFSNPKFDDPALPPLPTFMAAPPPVVNPGSSSTKSNSRPGFFRRVFGGGGSSTNVSSPNPKSSLPSAACQSPSPAPPLSPSSPPAPLLPPPPPPTDLSQSTINKKSSFFRRRKKSMSDGVSQPATPVPIQAAESNASNDSVEPSPVTSLTAAMNPYLRSPIKSRGFEETGKDHEPAYLQKNATIRTVASSDPISPRRPTFFGESVKNRDSGCHYPQEDSDKGGKGKKESRYARGETNADRDPASRLREEWDRPKTSPKSPKSPNQTFLEDEDEDERAMHWLTSQKRPILSGKRSVDNVALERERHGGRKRQSSVPNDKPRHGSIANERPIVSVRDIDRYHEREERQRRESLRSARLEVDTRGMVPINRIGTSGTPTVTLQKDGPGEKAELLKGEDGEDEEERDEMEPSEEERDVVRKIFEGDEEFVSKARAAAWLGQTGLAGERARKAYMEMFDWGGMNILSSLRMFCGKLVFKGETQQVDRIMEAFSRRWCECNPNHGFKNTDIVHTILYSLLLLNTDLHLADISHSQKMTRAQFIKNTMTTIQRGIADSPEPEPIRQSTLPPRAQTPFRKDSVDDSPTFKHSQAATFPIVAKEHRMSETSLDFAKSTKNGSKGSGVGSLSPKFTDDSIDQREYELDGGPILVNSPFTVGDMRAWETQVGIILKDFYHSVKISALPLHGSSQEHVFDVPLSSTLSVLSNSMGLRRSPSTISRAASEMSGSARHRDSKLGTKWTSKNRSRPRIYNGSYAGSSRTSLEDRSMWSPSASSTWSKYTLDKTQTSMSMDSLGSAFTHGDYKQSIGFANALSHAIIREEAASGTSVDDREPSLLDDDELELCGAPWAKEGLLKHKHHLESVDKRAKNRGWTECFAVIERGWMRLFQFPGKGSGKSNPVVGGVVGGGNWSENADSIGSFLLRQTIASALPPPGYSKTRANVWALSLPSGAVHFFEVGTPEIVREFVTTANYWSARLSKEPLVGGVSNVEYGWGDCISLVDISNPPSPKNGESRPSLQMSIRSSIDHSSTFKPKLPGDKVSIKDWSPPSQSMMASSLGETDQLKALENYVANIEAELQRHNELRPAMQSAFSPRHPNATKAMNNWEKKSSYLLREIIKFRTYSECLTAANIRREKLKAGIADDDVEMS